MIFELIGLIVAAAIGFGILSLIILTFLEVTGWFLGRNDLYYSDADHIAFTLQQKLSSGQYETVQGIFNKRTNKMADGRKIRSQDYDEQLKEKHKKETLVLWTE
jgi:hypothetical protein